jgi:hypothetical protein
MIVAKEKRKNNIAEYILYMWHIEDLIRACKMEFTIVSENLISGYKSDDTTKREISEWYQDIIHAMIEDKITVTGHLRFINKLIDDLNILHLQLLQDKSNINYQKYYEAAKPNIDLFKSRSNFQSGNEVEICLNALYTLLLLKLSKKEISPETLESMNSFSSLLSILSVYFKKMEEAQ